MPYSLGRLPTCLTSDGKGPLPARRTGGSDFQHFVSRAMMVQMSESSCSHKRLSEAGRFWPQKFNVKSTCQPERRHPLCLLFVARLHQEVSGCSRLCQHQGLLQTDATCRKQGQALWACIQLPCGHSSFPPAGTMHPPRDYAHSISTQREKGTASLR